MSASPLGACVALIPDREKRLNVRWFATMEDAKATIEAPWRDYNETGPHMSLKDASPEEYARKTGLLNAENSL
jgi:transposase InsO family protein